MAQMQIQLSEAQLRALKSLAAAQNKSTAELVHQAVDVLLRSTGSVERVFSKTEKEEQKRRAIAVAGRFSSSVSDLATGHDHYLAQAFSQ
jgi:uncharacterized iron-regulated protein